MPSLVPFAPDHFPILIGWFRTEADLVQWGGPRVRFPLSTDQLEVMRAEAQGTPPDRASWMAKHDGALVGHAQLAFDWRHGNALLSRVAVAPSMRGSGLAGPVLRLVVNQAFERPEIERVELNVYTWNANAIRVYERLGFRAEGVRRSSVRVGDERWDTAGMGLLRSEWPPSSA